MRVNKKYMAHRAPLCCGQNNYQLRLADEMANKKCHCYRFIESRQKYQQNEIVHMFDKDKRKIYKLPSLKKKKIRNKFGLSDDFDDNDF